MKLILITLLSFLIFWLTYSETLDLNSIILPDREQCDCGSGDQVCGEFGAITLFHPSQCAAECVGATIKPLQTCFTSAIEILGTPDICTHINSDLRLKCEEFEFQSLNEVQYRLIGDYVSSWKKWRKEIDVFRMHEHIANIALEFYSKYHSQYWVSKDQDFWDQQFEREVLRAIDSQL